MTQSPETRSADDPRITHGEAAGVTDTTTDGLVPPGGTAYEGTPVFDPSSEVYRLAQFLDEHFPSEQNRSNRQEPESAVDVAIRLLSGLSSQGTGIERCSEQYCNKPVHHSGVHGWVHYQ